MAAASETEINMIASIEQCNYCVYLLRETGKCYYTNSGKKEVLGKRKF